MSKSRRALARGPQRKALLVGINQYVDAPLKGCVNDALMLGNILIDHFGFTPGENMRLVVDQRATKKAILERLEWLVDGAAAGDVLVVHYSGHGSQVPARGADDEIDGLDECLIPIDHDWDHPLTDDDLAKFVDAVPEGVNLTVILDNCNSGTGLRILAPGAIPTAVKRLLPPPDIQFRAAEDITVTPGLNYYSVTMSKFRPLDVCRFGHAVTDKGILVAGCRSDQFAKDAYIEGDYHGALTFSLHEALKVNGPRQSYGQWVELATKILKERHQIADQDPQLECPEEMAGWRLFSTERASPAPSRSPRAAATRHLVYVHGICAHVAGYSDPWWESMREHTPSVADANRHEVLWSDVVNPAVRALVAPAPHQAEVARTIRDVLVDRAQRQLLETEVVEGAARGSQEVFATRAALGIPGLDCVDDFSRYLVDRDTRERILSRFREVLEPLLADQREIEIISHSWGTVVAYEALRLLDADRGVA